MIREKVVDKMHNLHPSQCGFHSSHILAPLPRMYLSPSGPFNLPKFETRLNLLSRDKTCLPATAVGVVSSPDVLHDAFRLITFITYTNCSIFGTIPLSFVCLTFALPSSYCLVSLSFRLFFPFPEVLLVGAFRLTDASLRRRSPRRPPPDFLPAGSLACF